ncbi:hypothetical protein WICPIJ_005375, partial [Wickerhamomyces pijperi]
EEKDPLQDLLHDHDEDDETKTLLNDPLNNATTLNYLRDEGILEGSTVFDGNFQENREKVLVKHNRSLSNDKHLKSQLSQLHYNNNRISLNRSILNAVQLLNELQQENSNNPVFYPSNDLTNPMLNSRRAHLALLRKQSMKSIAKEAVTQEEQEEDEESIDLNILKLNLKSDSHVVSKLDKSAIGQLLDGKITQVSKHLQSLKDRIDDITSKILITGDLNSGKSTFCNALLRRKVLPEDQQPCTTVFCEVIDYKENNGVEQVHAVPIGSEYNIRNESTYKIFQLKDLEHLVGECDKYSILKVYCTDRRSTDESLLRNGIVDIAIIDAPGLNLDSYQTTEVFARQEEIDLVIFVLSAENHFTLSAKEFISAATHEKKLMFFVINRYDYIKDKQKCQNRILEQVQTLSPDTHKDSKNFVHFISSSEIVDALPDGDGNGGDDNSNNDDFTNPNFDHLEESLRNFILQKRSLSKLQPAKTYLTKLFQDVESLAQINSKLYASEKNTLEQQLNEIQPIYERKLVESVKLTDKIEKIIDTACTEVYQYTKQEILTSLDKISESAIVELEGFPDLVQFTAEVQQKITDSIVDSVRVSETYAKKTTVDTLNRINKLGESTLGDKFNNSDVVFRDDIMFTRRKDTISRNLNNQVDLIDYFDPSIEGFLQFIGLQEKYSIDKSTLSYLKNSAYSSVGLFAVTKVFSINRVVNGIFHFGSFFSFTTLKYLALPVAIGAGLASGYYLICDMPRALTKNLSQKYKQQIKDLDYPHENSNRISKECNKVLKYPLKKIQTTYQTLLDEEISKKEKLVKSYKDVDVSLAFFNKLVKKALEQKTLVESYDLESINNVE